MKVSRNDLEGRESFYDLLAVMHPDEHPDADLFDIWAYQLRDIYRRSGKPVAMTILYSEGMVKRNNIFASAPYYVCTIWADMGQDGLIAFQYATEPIFPYGKDELGNDKMSVFQSIKFSSREEMKKIKSGWESGHLAKAIVTVDYPVDNRQHVQTKEGIDYFLKQYYNIYPEESVKHA